MPTRPVAGTLSTVPIPAATVVPLRDGKAELEVLLLLRNSNLDFAAGAWVFPGGRMDPDDYLGTACEADAARRAACREAREEAGLILDPAELSAFAHWTTPPVRPKRFATWFFLASVTDPEPVQVDGSEIVDYRWLGIGAALQAAEASQMPMIRPTLETLRRLLDHRYVAEAMYGSKR